MNTFNQLTKTKTQKKERACRDIKTEKAQEQDWYMYLSNKIKHHFHITTLHTCKYSFYVFCLYSSYVGLLCGSGV